MSPAAAATPVPAVGTAAPAAVPFRRVAGRWKLDDLWFFTGSMCNLACLHCYVGSSPRNRTYEFLSPDDVEPVLRDARRFGVSQVYFTGGEPFANPAMLGLLALALEASPATVLTNGTEPLARALPALAGLRNLHGDRLTFRVSLDHYEAARHNAIRRTGTGGFADNFEKTVENIARLAGAGFTPIVTYTAEVFRGNPVTPAWVEANTRDMFTARGVRVDVKILPTMIDQGAQAARHDGRPAPSAVTEEELAAAGVAKEGLMCHASRLVAKRNGTLHVYPCPVLVGADGASADALAPFDLGPSLAASLATEVRLAHPSCASYCAIGRATCANAKASS